MPFEFKMPDPGEGIHEAEVLEIKISEGDPVEEGQTILVVETDKASVDLPAPVTGKVLEIRVEVGDIVEVGDVLAVFRKEGEEEAAEGEEEKAAESEEEKAAESEEEKTAETEEEEAAEAEEESPPQKKEKPTSEKKGPREGEGGGKEAAEAKERDAEEDEERPPQKSDQAEDQPRRKGPVPATPATRRLARELDVALDGVEASGPGGRVMAEDVKAHAEGRRERPEKEPATEPKKEAKAAAAERPELPDFSRWGEVERTALRSIRRSTAKRMARSWEEIPHVTHEDVADITNLEKLRRDNRDDVEAQDGALTLTVFAIKAAVAALKRHPRFNASLDIEAQEIVLKKYFHIGIAVDTPRGLLVPVVRDADCKSMVELAREVRELAQRTREGELQPRDMSGGTFTITNVGPLGGTGFSPIINYPQVAILGLARARLQTVVRGDLDDYTVVPRLMLPLCMGFDHRVVDGADAARFMGDVVRLLENPQKLMLSQ